ncbi:hypothetical protein DyAD56_02760 [Dyella sp. AD56]|uniref:hypothetical protein n=1 Tax=Dyella sp. AD56 TaxID=1528744 RepID=UPI000CC99806|nr:hypothetical protein [Dyella sp. AD56]PMQ06812.1 hypothetical protein DyAD56_02760 [Dyella sp. AD56]
MAETNERTLKTRDRFTVRWVFGNITNELRRQLMAFWLREGALDHPDEAWRRSWEVACVLDDVSSGEVGGICTVAIALDERQRCYGFVRIYIGASNRHPGFNVRLMRQMIEGFEALAGEPGAPQRLIATIENRKIEGRGGQRLLARVGFQPIGRTPQGEMIIERRLVAA